MADSQTTTLEGVITENLPNALFRVRIEGDKVILCHSSGKMRINHIKLLPGDRVSCEVSNLDPNRGRIVFKLR